VGPPHEGKGSILKLIGQVCLPPEGLPGSIFVPPHLRILHMHKDLLFLPGSLLKNIIMNQKLSQVGGLDRVKRICRMLNFEAQLMKYLSSDEDDMDWRFYLTDTSATRLCLARAFIMNPEVLLIHKPTNAVNASECELFIDMLRRHVEEKGLELPADERRIRRPRTVFFTTAESGWVDGADRCYEVSEKNGITELERPEQPQEKGKKKVNKMGATREQSPPTSRSPEGSKSPTASPAGSPGSSPAVKAAPANPTSSPNDRFGMGPSSGSNDRSSSGGRRDSGSSNRSGDSPSPKMGPGKPKKSNAKQDRTNPRY
jgi:hypothetical protein